MIDFKKQGKKNRRLGSTFEKKVRTDLEKSNWIVSRWQNNVEFSGQIDFMEGKLIKAKSNRFNMRTTGFPDFIAFRLCNLYPECTNSTYEVIGVECKSNGNLDKIEKQKCEWLLKNNIFNKILIAKNSNGGIEYTEF